MAPLIRCATIACALACGSAALLGAPAQAQTSTTIATTPTTTSAAPTTSTSTVATTSTGRTTTTIVGATGRTTTTIVGATETTTPPSQLEGTKPGYVDQPKGARQLAAAYAYRWAYETSPAFALKSGAFITVPYDNPEQPGRAVEAISNVELDCTNYMSQALRAGGFQNTKQWWFDAKRRSASTAWVRASGPQGLSATFVKLGWMRPLGGFGLINRDPPPTGIQIGDIVVWDLNGVPGRVHIDHQLMVTDVAGSGATWADIRVSYHTYDHRNRAMNEYQDFVVTDAPNARLGVFHVNYPS